MAKIEGPYDIPFVRKLIGYVRDKCAYRGCNKPPIEGDFCCLRHCLASNLKHDK